MFSYQYQQCLSSSPPPSPKTYPSSTFFPFSPPTFLNEGLHDLLLASTLLPTPNVPPSDPPSPPNPPSAAASPPPPARTNSQSASGSNTRKRAMRKDRHSKIFTAQGPRDRRMRLSLEVAREFFDLQDMLGFDKASKTVKWLLTMSNTAIKDLATTTSSRPRDQHLFSESSTSECENISTVSDSKAKSQVQKPNPTSKAKRVATGRASRKSAAVRPVLAKESRAMARARARERTREKKISGQLQGALQGDINGHEELQGDMINGHEASQHAASSIPLETIGGGDESGSHERVSSLEAPPPAAAMEEERCSSQHRQFPGGINHNLENNQQNFTGNNDALSWFREHCELNLLVNVQGRLLNDAQQQSQLYQHLAYPN